MDARTLNEALASIERRGYLQELDELWIFTPGDYRPLVIRPGG
jgi:hypothetical protein